MGARVEVGTRELRCASRHAGDGNAADPATQATALVVALSDALRAACRLRSALDAITAYCPEAGSPPGVATVPEMGRPQFGGLSCREMEVLRLLAAGHSNHQIAHALCLSPRTVQRHVANIYLKIGAHCRAEATAYALDHGLR
jgi:DNA-binding NarL/FixJ family response regulator